MKMINVEPSDLEQIEGKRNRRFAAIKSPLSAELILRDIREHNRKRVIVLCNVVSLSQGLFQDLDKHKDSSGLEITLLHSRFLPEDRKEKETDLEKRFGKKWREYDDGKCHVLISTQVIEVGINITCEVMHTHLSPMSSLLQRAGRCARFGGRGEVRVYREIQVGDDNPALTEADIAEDVDDQGKQTGKKRQFLPYEDEICNLTWDVLQEHDASLSVGFEIEAQWVNDVHQRESELQIKRRRNNRKNFLTRFEDATFRGDRSASRELIRWVDNRNIFVAREPTFIDGESSEISIDKLEPFSLPRTTLCKALNDFNQNGTWLFKRIESPADKKAETYSQPILSDIRTTKDIIFSTRILVNPEYVFYDQDIGLRIIVEPDPSRDGKPFKPKEKQKTSVVNQYQYHFDTYVGHLALMWRCWNEACYEPYASVKDEICEAGGRFIREKVLPDYKIAESELRQVETTALFETLVFLAVLTHDLGKLQQSWQDSMRLWQKIAYEEFRSQTFKAHNPRSLLLAHTDYDPNDKETKDVEGRTQKQRMRIHETTDPRPGHAIESAFLGWEFLDAQFVPLLEDHFDLDEEQIRNLLSVVIMAAGRHHSAWTNGWELSDVAKKQSIKLHPQANQAVAKSWTALLNKLNLPSSMALPSEPFQFDQTEYEVGVTRLDCFEPDDLEYQQLYALVVRALRLCDSRSVQINHP